MTGSLEPKKPRAAVWISLLSLLVSAWVALIYLAVVVTKTTLAVLEYVVDLAQLY